MFKVRGSLEVNWCHVVASAGSFGNYVRSNTEKDILELPAHSLFCADDVFAFQPQGG